MTNRNLFNELADGFDALASDRVGNLALPTQKAEGKPAAEIAEQELTVRERLPLPGTKDQL